MEDAKKREYRNGAANASEGIAGENYHRVRE
jgi:hypothetical protein